MMRPFSSALAFAWLVFVLLLPAHAQTQAQTWKVIRPRWEAPSARFFASQDGRYALKVVPNGPTAVAALVTLDATGAERELWRNELAAFPVDAVIA